MVSDSKLWEIIFEGHFSLTIYRLRGDFRLFREHTCFGRLHSILQDTPGLTGLLQPRQHRLKIESTIVIVRLRYFVCFSKKILQNLHDWGLASAKKSNAENNKIILNMFLAQALFLNWYENQPPLQSKVKKTRLITKPIYTGLKTNRLLHIKKWWKWWVSCQVII